MKFFLFPILSISLLASCVAIPNRTSKSHAVPPERQRAIDAGAFTSIITAYHIPHGHQRDDSIFIKQDALKRVANMVHCPPLADTSGLHRYHAGAFIDNQESTVKIRVNRPNCSVDMDEVKLVLDGLIAKESQAWSDRYDRERHARETNPQSPYLMGCTDYQRFARGEKNRPDIKGAMQQHPKIDSLYVQRLYLAGWEDARSYGVRNVDCTWLSQVNVR